MLDLGGGHNSPAGYQSVDLVGGDINCDIRHGLPFADNSVACVRAYDFLEHIPHCHDSSCNHGEDGVTARCVVGVMNEIYRVLAPGGWLISRTPSTDGRGAFQDPTHVSFWNPNSFWYYTRAEQARYVPGIRCRFQATRIWQSFPSDWHKTHNILYVHADLVALKGQQQPGISEI
jgi:O-antigen biosynthesis protein